MKTRYLLALLAGCCLASLPLSAQTFVGSDDFNDNNLVVQGSNPQAAGQWRFIGADTGATWSNINGRLEYTNSGAQAAFNSSRAIWVSPSTSSNLVGGAGLTTGNPFTSSWSAVVSATNLVTPSAGYTYQGLETYTLTSTNGNNAYYGMYLSTFNGGAQLAAEWGIWNEGTGDFDRQRTVVGTLDTTDVLLRLDYNGDTKIMSAGYSLNGSTFFNVGSFDLDGAQAGLEAPNLNGLGLQLISVLNQGAGPVAAGELYFDNISVSAVPEPSTYAALAGLAALGLVMWRRRRQSVAAALVAVKTH